MKYGEGFLMGLNILLLLLKPEIRDLDLCKSGLTGRLKMILITTSGVMYGNKPIAWILYMHSLKI